jgi:tetratricopeptide (TPR) repeat protein
MSSPALSTVLENVDQRLLAGEFEEAIDLLQGARREAPRSYVLVQRLGDVYRSLMRTDEAIRSYDAAIAIAPEEGDLWVRKGDALSDLGDGDAAVQAFQEASRLAPSLFTEDDWNVRGDRCYSYGDSETARRLYECGLAVRPTVDGWRGLGVIAMDSGRLDDAAAAFHHGLELDPDNALVLNDLGRVHHRREELPEALDFFQRAAALAPFDANYRFNVGLISRESGNFAAARDAYLNAVELAPDDADTWIELGLCELELSEGETRLRTALRSFERATEVDESSFWGWNNAGWALKELRESEAALERLDRAISLNEAEVVPWSHKIAALVDLGELDRAEACATEMLDAVADKGEAARLKGSLLADWTSKNGEALALFRAALAEKPDDTWIKAAIAEGLFKGGDYPESRELARKVLAGEADEDTRCGLLFIVYASHVLEGSSSPGRRASFVEFIDYFRSHFAISPPKPVTWNFRGIIDAVQHPGETGDEESTFLLSMAIDLQQGVIDTRLASFFTGVPREQAHATSL